MGYENLVAAAAPAATAWSGETTRQINCPGNMQNPSEKQSLAWETCSPVRQDREWQGEEAQGDGRWNKE